MVHIHVDVDNLWTYEQEYGMSFGQPPDFLFSHALPRVLDFLAEHDARVTFFMVGRDLELPAAQQFCRDALHRGHALANHTYTHPTALASMSPEEKREEITRCHRAIRSVTGQSPVGFRAPGYYIDRDIIDTLIDLGYRYDSSVLPGPATQLMRWYSRFRGTAAGKTFGRPRDLIASRHPHRFKHTKGDGVLCEFPISVTPFLRTPSHTTFLYQFGWFYLATVKALYRFSPKYHTYLLHAIDFVDMPHADQFRQIIPFRWSLSDRLALVEDLLSFLTRLHGRPITTTESQLPQWHVKRPPVASP